MRAEEKLPSALVAVGHTTSIAYISIVALFRHKLAIYSREWKNNIVHAVADINLTIFNPQWNERVNENAGRPCTCSKEPKSC